MIYRNENLIRAVGGRKTPTAACLYGASAEAEIQAVKQTRCNYLVIAPDFTMPAQL